MRVWFSFQTEGPPFAALGITVTHDRHL